MILFSIVLCIILLHMVLWSTVLGDSLLYHLNSNTLPWLCNNDSSVPNTYVEKV